MVIKIKRKFRGEQKTEYKSHKPILTPHDIRKADKFDKNLTQTIRKIEKVLLGNKALLRTGTKRDPLKVWYTVGMYINEFLKENKVSGEDEDFFWEHLYGRSTLLQKGIPKKKVSKTRNDFVTASLLAQYPYDQLKKVGSWALWREILTYQSISLDQRMLHWIIDELIRSPRTRDEARPLLKNVARRFKRIDTRVLSDEELYQKLGDVEGHKG